MTDTAIVIPAPGTLPDTARLLLKLADHPHQVRTISNGTQFEVPAALAEAYHRALDGEPHPPPQNSPDQPKPARRRGRPPRVSPKE